MSNLYDTDFVRWTETQRDLLTEQRFDLLDLANLIEEIDSLGRSQQHSVKSHLHTVLMHLLKLAYTHGSRDPSRLWMGSIAAARVQIERLIEDSPSLAGTLDEAIEREYHRACREAHRELDRYDDSHAPFPETCPWTAEQIRDPDFFPQ